jgi:hypothetical protein
MAQVTAKEEGPGEVDPALLDYDRIEEVIHRRQQGDRIEILAERRDIGGEANRDLVPDVEDRHVRMV